MLFVIFFPETFSDVTDRIFAKLCHMTWHVLKLIMSYEGVHTCPKNL